MLQNFFSSSLMATQNKLERSSSERLFSPVQHVSLTKRGVSEKCSTEVSSDWKDLPWTNAVAYFASSQWH